MASKLEGGHTQSVLCVSFTHHGLGNSNLVSGGVAGELCVWTPQGNVGHKLQVNKEGDDVTCVCCSRLHPHELYVACGDKVYMHDLRQLHQPVHVFKHNEDEINQICLNEKETFLAACDDSGLIKVINLQEKKPFKTLRKHSNICSAVTFRPRRPWDILSGGLDSQLIQWDFSRGRSVCVMDVTELCMKQEADSYLVNPPFIHTLALSQTGDQLVCGTENALIQVFNSSKRNLEFRGMLHGHTQGVSQVHFPNIDNISESLLISGGNDGKVLFWDLKDWKKGQKLTNGTSHTARTSSGCEQEEAGGSDSLFPSSCIEHGEKVNWLTSGHLQNQQVIVVVDNSSDLTMYSIPEQ